MNQNRKLGKSDFLIPTVTLGGNVFGWTVDEGMSFRLLDHWVDEGFNFIDTADSYSKWVPGNQGGESETIIGKWLKRTGKRPKVMIATKVGSEMAEHKKGLSARYIKEAVEASLKRLNTDYIDLYQSHYDDPKVPVSETMQAFNDLISEGKVRFLGASNLSPERIAESNSFARENGLQPYISLQPLYNLFDRQKFENEYSSVVDKEQLGVLPYYSLASGFLTGKYRTKADLTESKRGAGIRQYMNERGMRILKAMDEVAAELDVHLSEIAISWLIHKHAVTSAIASATNDVQLGQLIFASNLSLSDEQMKKLDLASRIL